MQQLQESVLNKIQLGIYPVFIISPNIHDGDALAILLSNHLSVNNTYLSNDKNHNKNYFFTEEAGKLLFPSLSIKNEKAEKKLSADNADTKLNNDKSDIPVNFSRIHIKNKNEEYKNYIKFIVEKGFDNKKLWGLQLDYQLFFDLQIASLFPNAFFIFLYEINVKKYNNSEINYSIEGVYTFYKNNKHNSVLLHVNNVLFTPELILQNLPLNEGIGIKNISKTSDVVINKKNTDLYYYNNNEENVELKLHLDNCNLISQKNAWFNGREIQFILILTDTINPEILSRKINQYLNSFLANPFFHIICRNENEKRIVQKLLEDKKQIFPDIVTIACHSNISTSLNKIINETKCKYVIIDKINFSFPITNILSPYKNIFKPCFTFANITANKINADTSDKLSLVDMLTISSIPDNVSFLKDTWGNIKGFDEALDNKSAIWDFVIRLLKIENNYALEADASIANTEMQFETLETKYEYIEKNMVPYEEYKNIIEKHKPIFEQNLNRIVKIFSENQHIPQLEIIKLSHEIITLNSFLSHSSHELQSLNVTKSQLQNHIDLLESRWYYKLARKLSHYKNIFIKENASGKSIIINFLKFIFFSFTKPGLRIIRKILKSGIRKLYLVIEDRPVKIIYLDKSGNETALNYNDWIKHKLDKGLLKKEYNNTIDTLKIKPKISVILPVYNTPIDFLNEAIMSVINQFYDNWQLCIADDCSTNPQIKRILNSFAMKDKRINVVFRKENGHISEASNSALALANGEYVMLMDHDDILTPNAMFEVVRHINLFPADKFIYSDEDKIDQHNNFIDPYFKPNWSPDRFLAINYISHLATIEKKLLDSVGGFRKGFEGSQDYDLFLRISEHTNNIGHIQKILYHWRIHSASVASEESGAKPYAFIAGKKALEEALIRRNTPGEVHYLPLRGNYRIKYDIRSYDKVSIIIPTKDHVQLMRNTINSIFKLTSYPNFEVIVLNNNSITKDFFELMNEYQQLYPDQFKCIDANFPFNFSRLINLGVSVCKGAYVLMLNNDVEIIQNDWVTNMVSFCQYKRIGAVGVKLLYPNDQIQHAGTVVGLGSAAGHILVGLQKDSPGYFNVLQTAANYSAVTAACLMCRKEVFEEVGGMEEFLEVEFNDVDFCLKIIEHGYYNVYVPDVTLYHYESTTRGHPSQNKASHERHVREVGYFMEKWKKYVLKDPYYNPNLTLARQDFSVDLTI